MVQLWEEREQTLFSHFIPRVQISFDNWLLEQPRENGEGLWVSWPLGPMWRGGVVANLGAGSWQPFLNLGEASLAARLELT